MNNLNSILYRGQEYEVQLAVYPGKMTQIIFRDGKFMVYVSSKAKENKALAYAAEHLKLWMNQKADELIRQRTEELSKIINVNYNNIRIKDTKTRWGSCSSKGNLNFNFRIVMAPTTVMDYIIIHELCHLKHMNHSKEFWNTVEYYMPNYSLYKEWLKKNVVKLYCI